jgi:glycosyltransferase involved in cell wall biosynthesis
VLVACCSVDEPDHLNSLIELNRSLGSPAEILPNLSHLQARDLVQQASIYLHTNALMEPIGMSVGIAEAMATGCYVIARRCDPAVDYLGDDGHLYRNQDEAADLLNATLEWTSDDWRRTRIASVDRAYRNFAGPKVLKPLYQQWLSIADLGTSSLRAE